METLAEAGLVGFALIVGLLLALLGAGIWTVMRAPPLARVSLAGATAAFVGFCAAAGFDWVWQLPAIPIAALLLGAAIVAYREHRPRERSVRWPGLALRGGVAVLALAAAVAVAIPLAATTEYRSSQAAAQSGNLRAALGDALTAQSLEPYAATPRLQQALVYEALHDFPAASLAIAQATERAPMNWQLWLIRSRIEAEGGHARAAVRDFRRAHALNPLSPATAE
jgi:tetratricopeptide (TPR) repeat protein